MRYLDIIHVITENRQQYVQMLQPLVTLGAMAPDQAPQLADAARKKLKRNDRIVWWLRNYRLHELTNKFYDLDDQVRRDRSLDRETLIQKRNELANQFKKITGVQLGSVNYHESDYFKKNFNLDSRLLNHYVGMFDMSPDIERLQWSTEDSAIVMATKLQTAENTWKEKQAQVVTPQEKDTILIDYGKTAWMLLPRSYCDAEGKAMGHCGNAGNPQDGDRILSYRTKEEGIKWRPHLTFVLHQDGFLGEMKGRNNQKPDAKYHKVIVDLLKHEIVKGIRGGGYKPENNFQIDDLPENMQDQLIEEKPTLANLNTLYRRFGMTDDIKQQIEEVIADYTTVKPRWLDEQQKMVLGPFSKFSEMSEVIWGTGGKSNVKIFTKIVDSLPIRTTDDEQDTEEEASDQTRKQIRQLFDYESDAGYYQRNNWSKVYQELNNEGQYDRLLKKLGFNTYKYYRLEELNKKSPQFKQAYENAIANAFADHVYAIIRGMLASWLESNRDRVYRIRNHYSVALDYSRAVEKTQLAKSSEYPPPSLWFLVGPHPGHKYPEFMHDLKAEDIVEKLFVGLA